MKKLTALLFSTVFVLMFAGHAPAGNDSYQDGTYRGIFADRGDIQVSLQFTLEDNKVTVASFRELYHSGIDYLTTKDYATVQGIREQHQALIDYLKGKDIRHSLDDLYNPGEIATKDVDGFTGATLRSGKIISAVRDGLNRGIYRY